MKTNYPDLETLFEIKLEYKESTSPVSLEGKVGEYIGSGKGTVVGPEVNGTVHWTLFEAQNERVCQSNLFGVISTADGAEIKFDSMGLFMVPDREKPHLWKTSAGVSFETNNENYLWINSLLGVWEGEFDSKSYHHHYRVYARVEDR